MHGRTDGWMDGQDACTAKICIISITLIHGSVASTWNIRDKTQTQNSIAHFFVWNGNFLLRDHIIYVFAL